MMNISQEDSFMCVPSLINYNDLAKGTRYRTQANFFKCTFCNWQTLLTKIFRVINLFVQGPEHNKVKSGKQISRKTQLAQLTLQSKFVHPSANASVY